MNRRSMLTACALVLASAVQSQSTAAPSVPADCAKEVSSDTGQPVFFPRQGALLWGLSTRPAINGSAIPIAIWIYNTTDKVESLDTCSIQEFFQSGFDLFDSSSWEILSKSDEELYRAEIAAGRLLSSAYVCTANGIVTIQPHACLHGKFSSFDRIYTENLADLYSSPLKPGEYFLVPAVREPYSGPSVNRTRPKDGPFVKLEILPIPGTPVPHN
jgi:hypothetical protein